MAQGDTYRQINPQTDQLIIDSAGNIAGIRSQTASGTELRAAFSAAYPGLLNIGGATFSPHMGASVVLFGDSMVHRCTGYFTPTSIVRVNGIATVTLAGHGLGSGKIVDHNNATDGSFNVRGVAITRTSANTFTFPCAGADATAVAIAGRQLIFTLQEQINDDGFWFWLMDKARFGAAFRMVKNAGVSSNTSADMLARVVADVLSYQSDWVFFRPTIYNDVVNAGYTLAQIIQFNELILAILRAAGRKVLLIGPPAFNTGNTTARHQIWLGAIKWMRKKARENPGVYFADAYAKQVDALAATPGNCISGMLANEAGSFVHESPRGADMTAAAIWEAIGALIPKYQPLVSSSGDNYGADSSNTNILDFGFWTNTGTNINAASGGGAASGTLDSHFQADAVLAATGTAVWTMPARSDGIGYDAQVVLTPKAASDYAAVRLANGGLIPVARWTPGQKVLVAFESSIAGLSGSGIRTENCVLNFSGGSNPTAISVIAGQASAYANWRQTDFTLQFLSNEIVTPTDAGITAADLQHLFVAGAAGSSAATCKVGAMSINKQ